MTEFSKLCEAAGISQPVMSFLGGGNMASALIEGCLKSGFLSKEQVALSTRSEKSASCWKEKGFNSFSSNSEMLTAFGKGVIVLSVKPQMRADVYKSLSNEFSSANLVISVMAGIPLATLKAELAAVGFTGSVVRIMPNTPCAIGAGASLLTSQSDVPQSHISIARQFASSVGICVVLDEKAFNAGAAVAGSGPAWVYMFIEALADGGVAAGCARKDAMQLAAQTVLGAARMVAETGEHPGQLKDKVCSPAGTTIAGLAALEKAGFRSSVIEAVKAATDRANSM